MRLRNVFVYGLGLALATTTVACGGGTEPAKAPAGTAAAPAAGGQKVDSATAGEVKGVVTIDGTAPKNEPIKMNADPVCVREAKGPQTQETYMVGADGKAAVLRLLRALLDWGAAPPDLTSW